MWILFTARALRTSLPPTLAPAMFLAVWLLYAADRLLDTRNRTHNLQPRHHFHHDHRTRFAAAILVFSSALAVLIPRLPASLLHLYLFLAALLLVWFVLIHFTRLTLPKEFAPGLFFAAAIFIPIPHATLPAILFAALCTLNCLYIHQWEHPQSFAEPASRVPHPHDSFTVVRVGLGRRPTAPAHVDLPQGPHPATHLVLIYLPQLTIALALLPLAHPSPITIAISLSALALLALDHYHHHLAPTHLRAAADLALLTPLLILPFLP